MATKKAVCKAILDKAKKTLARFGSAAEEKIMIDALKEAFEAGQRNALSRAAKETAALNEPADVCDECGAEYPATATYATGLFHKKSCSLHADNCV